MLFSEQFNIAKTDNDDWLDIIIDADTKLFVDPFLVFLEEDGPWSTSSHEEIIRHFETCFTLIVEGNMKPAAPAQKKAVNILKFKEPKEFCLGFTAKGTDGAGGGDGYAKSIAKAMVEAIERGLQDLQHFEELGILVQQVKKFFQNWQAGRWGLIVEVLPESELTRAGKNIGKHIRDLFDQPRLLDFELSKVDYPAPVVAVCHHRTHFEPFGTFLSSSRWIYESPNQRTVLPTSGLGTWKLVAAGSWPFLRDADDSE